MPLFDWDSLRRQPLNEELLWEDASDLARLSIASFIAENSPIRRDLSSGFVRLTGAGVDGHAASLDGVAATIHNFQRLVTATGLALTGWRTLRGRAPADALAKTKLNLDGSAMPGSLILQLVPATLPGTEIMPSGQGEFFRDDDSQLVDQAMKKSIQLLNYGAALSADADTSPFLGEVNEAGPRVASALRDLTKGLVDEGFATEVVWEQPRNARLRSRLSVPQLAQIAGLVASRELAREPVVLVGVLRTVSDISPLKLEIAPNEFESINASRIARDVIAGLNVGVRVRVEADVSEDVSPGGEAKVHYAATRIDITD